MLTALPVFQHVGDGVVDVVLAGARSIFVEPRHVLTSAGAQAVLLVISGRVQLATVTDTGDRSIYGVLGPGTLIGDAALLDEDAPRPIDGGGAFAATVTALEDCLYLAIESRVFRHLMATDVRFAGNVARALARALRMMIVRDAWVTTLELPVRLARFIAWLADREGVAGDCAELTLRISQESLGELVAATRESVNKHLREWSRLGVVEHVGGHLRILDIARLRAIGERENV